MPPTSEIISAATMAAAAASTSSITTHQEIRDRYSAATAGASTILLATRIRTRKVEAVDPRPRSSRSVRVVRIPTVTISEAPRASASSNARSSVVPVAGKGTAPTPRSCNRSSPGAWPSTCAGITTSAPQRSVSESIDSETLRCGAEVVIPAHVDGHAPGLERLQDLGVGAVPFPATGTTEALALLLADARGASLIVTVGIRTTLTDLLDRGRGSTASTFLVRMRVANKVVEAPAVATLYRSR